MLEKLKSLATVCALVYKIVVNIKKKRSDNFQPDANTKDSSLHGQGILIGLKIIWTPCLPLYIYFGRH